VFGLIGSWDAATLAEAGAEPISSLRALLDHSALQDWLVDPRPD
jgi:hypothetical protein